MRVKPGTPYSAKPEDLVKNYLIKWSMKMGVVWNWFKISLKITAGIRTGAGISWKQIKDL